MLMSRVSSLDVTLRDEWKINRSNSGDAFMPTRRSVSPLRVQSINKFQLILVYYSLRPAIIFMHGDLGWDQLQIMISKSTTADLLKMFYKLDEFFSQQFKSSKRVFSSLQPRHQRMNNTSIKRKQQKKKSTLEGEILGDVMLLNTFKYAYTLQARGH